MGAMKEFGMRIARMLFDQKMPVKKVVDALADEVFLADDPNGGLPFTYTIPRDWLEEQVIAVKTHPEMWMNRW